MANWRTVVGLILSGIGFVVSFSSFVFFYYGNYHAAVWALLSGLLAAVDFHLLFLDWCKTLSSWHTTATIKDFEILGIAGLILGLGAASWYIFVFLYYNLPILPVPESYQIASVWALMTAKWGLGLLLTTRHLSSELQENYPELRSSSSFYRSRHYYTRIAV